MINSLKEVGFYYAPDKPSGGSPRIQFGTLDIAQRKNLRGAPPRTERDQIAAAVSAFEDSSSLADALKEAGVLNEGLAQLEWTLGYQTRFRLSAPNPEWKQALILFQDARKILDPLYGIGLAHDQPQEFEGPTGILHKPPEKEYPEDE